MWERAKAPEPSITKKTSWHQYGILTHLVKLRHGAQGTLDTASKASLENEFNTKSEDEAIIAILEKGTIVHTSVCFSEHHIGEASLTFVAGARRRT